MRSNVEFFLQSRLSSHLQLHHHQRQYKYDSTYSLHSPSSYAADLIMPLLPISIIPVYLPQFLDPAMACYGGVAQEPL